ncbi:MAG: rhodanese-like domain-containing protein [Planctomycetes bacterium]|nr:rhodanese-like domain-containing protein [Planctomycetota bacterium]
MKPEEFVPGKVEIDGQAAAKLARTPPGGRGRVVVIDVREDDEWAAGHVEGAVHLPLSRIEREWPNQGFGKEDTLILYCAAGMRSLDAAYYLGVTHGFDGVKSVTGGMAALPMPKTAPPGRPVGGKDPR